MKATVKAAVALTAAASVKADAPVAKVLSMLSDLAATITKEGEVAQEEYTAFSEWCEDRARNLGFEIKTGKSEADTLKASIVEETSNIAALSAKAEELAGNIATHEADLKAATEIRAKENADYAAEDNELVETIDMLHRATGILEREMQGGASMLQATAGNLAQAFAAMVQASAISSSDAARLTALVQDAQKAGNSEDDEAVGAPAATVYGSHSGDIVQTLQDLTDKAEGQLSNARNTETANLHNFENLKQSLEDAIRFAKADRSQAKAGIAASSERKAAATGDLSATSKDLASDVQSKASLQHDCMTKASIFEAETRSRAEELKALAEAKKVIQEATGAAALGQLALVQVARSTSSSDQKEAVRLVRDLARKDGSAALAQLASRVASAMHSQDPFGKIKGLISDMIEKLEAAAGADATHKAYCDKELSETNTKKSEKTAEIQKLTTRVNRMSAQSAQLKEEIAALQGALAKLARSQAEMDRMRQEENTAFKASKAELEKALTGIKLALNILNEYYAKDKAHVAADGASSSIISLLEVCEADFSKNLAQITSDEDLAASEYTQVSKDNEIEKNAKQQDVRYKAKESKYLDKFSGELIADRSGVQAELDAVLEYLSKIESECIEKAETYANRKARRESELAGLKEALTVLESETAFIQTQAKQLRGGNM